MATLLLRTRLLGLVTYTCLAVAASALPAAATPGALTNLATESAKGGASGGWASVAALPCGTRMPDRDPRSYGTLFATNGVNQRSGPSTGCTILGRGYLNHRLDYHCFDIGQMVNGHSTWTYLRNVTTGRYGWVNDSLLDANADGTRGSLVECP